MITTFKKILKTAALGTVLLSSASTLGMAQGMEKIHFIIPGGAGGGWDGTARGVGEALKNQD